MAFPYSVVLNNKDLLVEIKKIIEKENIDEVVIGESKNFAMEPNKIMKEIEEFKKTLEEDIKLPIYFEPEFMTSQQAELIQHRRRGSVSRPERREPKNKMHDASAATIILQSYIDRLK
jgi:RNase H-fold protein (predicted Holliday junction resolvase)